MANSNLSAVLREGTGKNKVDKVRQAGRIPGVVYKKGMDNVFVSLETVEFEKVFADAGSTGLIDLNVEGEKKHTVLIKDFQRHPFKNLFLHVDFQEVDMNEELRVEVPIVLVGRDDIRVQPSVLNHALDTVEIETLPANIPSQAEVVVTDMQIDDVFYVKDLDIAKDENITILTDLEEVVCSLTEPREEEIEKEVDENAEPEVIGEEKEEEEE